MKFVLLVEGRTERDALPSFLKRWLDPRLNQRVGIQPVKFNGWRDMNKSLAKKARSHLDSPARQGIIAVIGLMDLYGPDFYPPNKTTPLERLNWATEKFEEKVRDKRFRMFFAVHETEAWLLSKPDMFPTEVASAFPGKVKKPEEVNFDDHPSRLLDRLYREKTLHTYKKTEHGVDLFSRLDPEVAYDKCPQLKRMLDEMRRMAEAAGM